MQPSGNLETKLKPFLDPSPRKSDYWERLFILRSLQELAPLLNPGSILDVGCGLKPYENVLRQREALYWGVDYPVTLANAHGMVSRADVFADCLRLPFGSGTMDNVVCTQVLEHVREPGILVGEMARVLRPGGRLLLSAPMAWPLHEEPFDFYRFTVYGFRHLFQTAGLEIVKELERAQGVYALGQLFLTLMVEGPKQRHGLLWKVMTNATCMMVNKSCPLLDRIWPKPGLCLGWTILAQKASSV
jgi:SAM-dependent methyltransferase